VANRYNLSSNIQLDTPICYRPHTNLHPLHVMTEQQVLQGCGTVPDKNQQLSKRSLQMAL